MKRLLKSTIILSVSATCCKIIGALYRIPLTNLIKSQGIGIYQTVFPVFTVLLTISNSGIVSAVAKLTAEGFNPKKVVYKSIIALFPLTLAAMFAMILLSKVLSKWQNSPSAYSLYIAIAPSVVLVFFISLLRGYYQGKNNMLPTALSQIAEQLFKMISGLILIKLFAKTPAQGAFYAALAVTLSEAFALIFLVLFIRHKPKPALQNNAPQNNAPQKTAPQNITIQNNAAENTAVATNNELKGNERLKENSINAKEPTVRRILKITFPAALISVMIPLSHFADSFLILNLIGQYSDKALNLYGLYCGGAQTVTGLPISVCGGIACAALPYLAESKNNKNYKKVILLSGIVSFIFAVITFFGAGLAVKILFPSLTYEERAITIKLIKIGSLSVAVLPVLQTANVTLVACDKQFVPPINMFIGVLVKIILTAILVKIPSVNICGSAFSEIACYFVAAFLNLLYIIKEENKYKPLFLKSKGLKGQQAK